MSGGKAQVAPRVLEKGQWAYMYTSLSLDLLQDFRGLFQEDVGAGH